MRSFRLIVFDLDGVLVDTSPCHARAFEELWREIGIEGPPYEELAGRPTREIVTRVTAAHQPSAEQIASWTLRKQALAREAIARAPIVFPDTLAAMDAFVRSGLPLALGTGASRASAETALERLGLAGVLEPVVTGEDVEHGKPHPETYLRALSQAGTDARDALIVEDSTAGLEAAVASGAWTATVRTGNASEASRFLGSWRNLAELARDLEIA